VRDQIPFHQVIVVRRQNIPDYPEIELGSLKGADIKGDVCTTRG
jgi:hypothetical protein